MSILLLFSNMIGNQPCYGFLKDVTNRNSLVFSGFIQRLLKVVAYGANEVYRYIFVIWIAAHVVLNKMLHSFSHHIIDVICLAVLGNELHESCEGYICIGF